MNAETKNSLDYEKAIPIAENVYWVGFYDKPSGLHCNPYLMIDGEEAVVIDGGSRPDFPTVMMKILQTGINPSSIIAMIYQHYDPDLVGSISNFEDIIGKEDLRIISDAENKMFIRHYSVSSPLISLDQINHQFQFSSGRTLRFMNTPYSHSAGSFITFDEQSGVLFTSDLFSSYGAEWNLFLELDSACHECRDFARCVRGVNYCPIPDILEFHSRIMTSQKALGFALKRIQEIPFSIIAPQHGSVIPGSQDVNTILCHLLRLKGVGIDGILPDQTGSFNKRLEADA